MPLRVFALSNRKGSELTGLVPAVQPRSFWRTSLLLVTSAAFGGIAVAIWNRRTLALIRQQSETTSENSADPSPKDG